jgi:hypothetical protein
VAEVQQKLSSKAPETAKPKNIPAEKPLFFMEAVTGTVLKKFPKMSTELSSSELVEVEAGRKYGVVSVTELARDCHVFLELAAGAGGWFVWSPHWKRHLKKTGEPAVQPPTDRGIIRIDPEAVDWTNFDARVSPHLTVGEVLQWDKRRRPQKGSKEERAIFQTAAQFEYVRRGYQGPLGVTSFYRPEPINQEVGGVPGSEHTKGTAMDIYPIGRPISHLYSFVRNRWSGGLGDGRAKGFLHLDTCGGSYVPGAGVFPSYEWNY